MSFTFTEAACGDAGCPSIAMITDHGAGPSCTLGLGRRQRQRQGQKPRHQFVDHQLGDQRHSRDYYSRCYGWSVGKAGDLRVPYLPLLAFVSLR